jgi:hypothetical protein
MKDERELNALIEDSIDRIVREKLDVIDIRLKNYTQKTMKKVIKKYSDYSNIRNKYFIFWALSPKRVTIMKKYDVRMKEIKERKYERTKLLDILKLED